MGKRTSSIDIQRSLIWLLKTESLIPSIANSKCKYPLLKNRTTTTILIFLAPQIADSILYPRNRRVKETERQDRRQRRFGAYIYAHIRKSFPLYQIREELMFLSRTGGNKAILNANPIYNKYW